MWRRTLALAVIALAGCQRTKTPPPPAPAAPPPPPKVVEVDVTPSFPLVPLNADVREGSSVVLARAGERRVAFVADEEEEAIHTVDLATRAEIARTDLEGRPTQLLITPEGTLAVALRDAATVALIGLSGATAAEASASLTKPLKVKTTLPTADEPVALALAPDGALWVASGWGHALEEFAARKKLRSFTLGREPRALAIAADGARAFVGYAADGAVDAVTLGDGLRRGLALASSGHFIPAPKALRFDCPDEWGAGCGGSGFAAPDHTPDRVGRQVFALVRMPGLRERFLVPHVEVGAGEPFFRTSGYGGGGVNVNTTVFAIAVVDGATATAHLGKVPDAAFAADGTAGDFAVGEDCRLPRGAVLARDGMLAMACAGSDSVVLYDANADAPALHDKGGAHVAGGPWGIAWDPKDDTFWVATAFTRTLQPIGRNDMLKGQAGFNAKKLQPAIALSHREGRGLTAAAAEGRLLFHDATNPRISSDGRACASCHPDGRDDGLVWPTPKGPRQTLLLAGRVRREPPFGWDGQHKSLVEHVKSTLVNLHGTGLSPQKLEAIAAYLVAIPPPPRRAHPPTDDETRGAELFASAQTTCFACHGADSGFTDGAAHDVKSATTADSSKSFLAPSLRYIAGSAPYFHDGRYATLAELIRGCDGTMGTTKDLSDADVRALEAYLRTL